MNRAAMVGASVVLAAVLVALTLLPRRQTRPGRQRGEQV
jgi:hypothetical protein